MDTIDQTAKCRDCHTPIEHVAGTPGSDWLTGFWRHLLLHTHPAVPDPATVRDGHGDR